jgi:hypothetical protein
LKTKNQLVEKIIQNADSEANELISHAKGVAQYINEHFPNDIPDEFFMSVVKSTDSALIGKLRLPSVTGAMMLNRLNGLK